jgi:hypothetical protein
MTEPITEPQVSITSDRSQVGKPAEAPPPVTDPTKSFARRLNLLPWFYLLLLIILCVTAVWRPLLGPEDFWAHAAVGRWICENQTVPTQTLFLWTAAESWTDNAWLTQVLFYGLTRIAPANALSTVVLAFTAILVCVPYVLAWRVAARRAPVSSWMILPFALGIIMHFSRYQARPELFTALFLSCLMVFLIRWSETSSPRTWRSAAVVLVLFLAWANFDSGVVVGLALLALTVICDLLQDRGSRRARTLALLALLAPLAACINPYFLDYWTFEPRRTSRFFLFADWVPVWTFHPLPFNDLAVQGLILTLAVAAWAQNPQRRWAHLAWLIGLSALCAASFFTGWLLTIGSLLVMAANMNGLSLDEVWYKISRRRPTSDVVSGAPVPNAVRWLVRFGLVSWLLLQLGSRGLALVHYDRAFLPVHLDRGVIRFTREHDLAGRMFNDFENSRYLEWCLAGEPSLFIDMQRAYPLEVFRDYMDIVRATPRGQKLLVDHGIGFVVLSPNYHGPSSRQLANFLDQNKDWKRVYGGWDGIIWVRRTQQYAYLWRDANFYVNQVPWEQLEVVTKGDDGPHVAFAP